MQLTNEMAAFIFLFFVLFNWYWVQRSIDSDSSSPYYRLYPSCIIEEKDDPPKQNKKTSSKSADKVTESLEQEEIPTLGKRHLTNPTVTQKGDSDSKMRDDQLPKHLPSPISHRPARHPIDFQAVPSGLASTVPPLAIFARNHEKGFEFPILSANTAVPSMMVYQISQGHVANVYQWPIPRFEDADKPVSDKPRKKKDKKEKLSRNQPIISENASSQIPEQKPVIKLPFNDLDDQPVKSTTKNPKSEQPTKQTAKQLASFLSVENSPVSIKDPTRLGQTEDTPEASFATFKSALPTATPHSSFVSPVKTPKDRPALQTVQMPRFAAPMAADVEQTPEVQHFVEQLQTPRQPTVATSRDMSEVAQLSENRVTVEAIAVTPVTVLDNSVRAASGAEGGVGIVGQMKDVSRVGKLRLSEGAFGVGEWVKPDGPVKDKRRPDSPPTPMHRPRKTVSFLDTKSGIHDKGTSVVKDSPIIGTEQANLTASNRKADTTETEGQIVDFQNIANLLALMQEGKSLGNVVQDRKPNSIGSSSHDNQEKPKPQVPELQPTGLFANQAKSSHTPQAGSAVSESRSVPAVSTSITHPVRPQISQQSVEMLEEPIGPPLKIKLSEETTKPGPSFFNSDPSKAAILVPSSSNKAAAEVLPSQENKPKSSFFGSSLTNNSIFSSQPPPANSIFAKKTDGEQPFFGVSAALSVTPKTPTTTTTGSGLFSTSRPSAPATRTPTALATEPVSSSFIDRLDNLNNAMSNKRIKRN